MEKCKKHKACLCIIDDDEEIAELYKNYINHHNEFFCFKTFQSVTDFLQQIAHYIIPDLLILDIGLPDIRGDNGVTEIKKHYPDIKIIIFSVHTDEDIILQSYLNGASSFVSKGEALPKMLAVLDIIHHGGSPFNSQLARILLDIQEKNRDTTDFLSDNDINLLKEISAGSSETYLAVKYHQSIYELTKQFKNIIDRRMPLLKAKISSQ